MTSNQHGPYVRGYTRVTMGGTESRKVKRDVKCTGSTGELRRELVFLSEYDGVGIRGVAVKCLDITKNADCEGSLRVLN